MIILEGIIVLLVPAAALVLMGWGVRSVYLGLRRQNQQKLLESARWKACIHTQPTKVLVTVEKLGEEPIVIAELGRTTKDIEDELMTQRARAESMASTLNIR